MAEVSGKFRYQATFSSEYPAVGDFVLVNWNESGNSAIIESLLPRKSAFIRKAAGEPQQEQIVAANIDTIFLCMALNNDFNIRRLERYLSIAWDSCAMPVVVLTKSDLCDDLDYKLSEVSSIAFGLDILVQLQQKKMDTGNFCHLFRREKQLRLSVLPAWENLLLSIFYWVKSS